jgi:hypothetical protein
LILVPTSTFGCAGTTGEPVQRNPTLHSQALENRTEFRSGLAKSCGQLAAVDHVISQAISIGAPIYNAGSPLGCYRIYEGTAYKLLYVLGSRCSELTALLRAGLAQARTDAAVDRKAWTMRHTFDTILGEETAIAPLNEAPL